jgi:hypothetical protein
MGGAEAASSVLQAAVDFLHHSPADEQHDRRAETRQDFG